MVLKNFKGIRSLIYLVLFFLAACSAPRERKESEEPISVVWQDNRAVAITIPKRYIDNTGEDSLRNFLTVHLPETNAPAILGEYSILEDHVRFEPLIPFTRQSKYLIKFRGSTVGNITIAGQNKDLPPVLLDIFPAQDTLPQNLLKFYFHFSKPMREGQSLKHVFLLKNERDTLEQVFLDLQPELWNEDRTMLTVWLDPGRIKRDLQPNRTLGEPLEQHASYRLVVNNTWGDIHGTLLKEVSQKQFLVYSRDTLSPAPHQWTLKTPAAGTRDPLEIYFHENLDHALLNTAIKILDQYSNDVTGKIKLKKEESVFSFTPNADWTSGLYVIRCDGRLEDLAGNNLNRPFDRNIPETNNKVEQDFFFLKFNIKKPLH